MFQAKLASVNPNRRNVAIFHHVTFATAGLLHALFEIVYDPQHNVHVLPHVPVYIHTHTHTHTHTAHTNTCTFLHTNTCTFLHTRTHTRTHMYHAHTHTLTHTIKHPNRGLLYLIH